MKNLSFKKRIGFALSGIKNALRTESSLRLQMIAAIFALLFFALLKASPIWWGLVSVTVGMVLTTEMLNTALERLIDHLHPEQHESIRIVKDCAAGAVLIASFASLGVLTAFVLEKVLS